MARVGWVGAGPAPSGPVSRRVAEVGVTNTTAPFSANALLSASNRNSTSTPALTAAMCTPNELTNSFVTARPRRSEKVNQVAFPDLEARYGTVLRQCRTVSTDTPVSVRI